MIFAIRFWFLQSFRTSYLNSSQQNQNRNTAAEYHTIDDHTLTALLTSALWLDRQNLYFPYCSLTARRPSIFTLIGARITYQIPALGAHPPAFETLFNLGAVYKEEFVRVLYRFMGEESAPKEIVKEGTGVGARARSNAKPYIKGTARIDAQTGEIKDKSLQ